MITILNRSGITVGVLTNEAPLGCSYYNDVQRQVIQNTLDTFQFKVRADHEMAAVIEVEGYVVFKDLDGLSRIYTVKEIFDNHSGDKYREVHCEDTAIDELIGNVIRPITLNGSTAQNAISEALSGTNWIVGRVSFTDLIDYEMSEPKTSLEMLHDIAEYYEGEIYYDVDMSGTSRLQMRVNLTSQRGQYTGKIFEYNKDLENIQKTESTTNLVTALIPFGQNGITIEGMSTVLPEPYYISLDFVANRDSFQRYHKNGKHIFGYYKDSSTTQQELLNNSLKKLKELSKPKVSYDCNAIALERVIGLEHEKVRIGDVVVVKDLEYTPPLITEARVVEIERSLDNPSADKIVIGDYIPGNITRTTSNQNNYNNSIIDNINNRVIVNESSITQLNDEISLKVNQTNFNELTGRVDTAESSITILADEIDLKVSTSTFNVLTGRMDTAESNITQNANQIALKVNTTTFNDLEERVGTAELKITDSSIVSTVRSSVLYTGDLAAKESNIYKQTTAPSHLSGRLWLDTSVTPNILKRSTGSSWIKATPTTAGEVGAYTTFTVDSMFSQTADEIALKVTMGDVVNSLNVNTAGISINAGNIDLTGITTVNSTLRVGGSTQYGKIILFSESGVNKALITAESQLFDEALLLTADVVEIGSAGGTGMTTLRFTDSLGGSVSGNVVFQNNVTFSGTVTGVPAYFG